VPNSALPPGYTPGGTSGSVQTAAQPAATQASVDAVVAPASTTVVSQPVYPTPPPGYQIILMADFDNNNPFDRVLPQSGYQVTPAEPLTLAFQPLTSMSGILTNAIPAGTDANGSPEWFVPNSDLPANFTPGTTQMPVVQPVVSQTAGNVQTASQSVTKQASIVPAVQPSLTAPAMQSTGGGTITDIPGTVSPWTVPPAAPAPVVTALPDQFVTGPDGEQEAITNRTQLDYGPNYGALVYGELSQLGEYFAQHHNGG